MPRSTTSVRLPDDLIEALDERAAALGITRSQLIIEAVQQALENGSAWSPGFLKALGTPRDDVAISQVTAAEIEFGLRYLPASRRRRSKCMIGDLGPVREESCRDAPCHRAASDDRPYHASTGRSGPAGIPWRPPRGRPPPGGKKGRSRTSQARFFGRSAEARSGSSGRSSRCPPPAPQGEGHSGRVRLPEVSPKPR